MEDFSTKNMGEIVLYQTEDGVTKLNVHLQNESVWLSQDQIAELYQRDKSVISRHIRNIFAEGELEEKEVVAFFATTSAHGAIEGLTQTHMTAFYNLDVIISVGYRVKSILNLYGASKAKGIRRISQVSAANHHARGARLLRQPQAITSSSQGYEMIGCMRIGNFFGF